MEAEHLRRRWPEPEPESQPELSSERSSTERSSAAEQGLRASMPRMRSAPNRSPKEVLLGAGLARQKTVPLQARWSEQSADDMSTPSPRPEDRPAPLESLEEPSSPDDDDGASPSPRHPGSAAKGGISWAADEVRAFWVSLPWLLTSFLKGCAAAATLYLAMAFAGCDAHPQAQHWSPAELGTVRSQLQQIDKKLDHVQSLRTDMDYLRNSKQRQERQTRGDLKTFEYQDKEVGRTRVQIDALKDKLLGAGQGNHPAVHNTTVLSCDWIDAKKLAFNNSRDAAGEPLHPENLTGCHLPVEAGDADQVFDCFNGAGRPQGCHAYAKAKVARLTEGGHNPTRKARR